MCVTWLHLQYSGSTYIGECVLCGSIYTVYCVAPPTLASVCCVAPPTLCIAWLHLHWRVCVVWLHLHCVLRGSTYIGECIRPVRGCFFDPRRAVFSKYPENPVENRFRTRHCHDVLPGNPSTATILVRFRNHVDRKLNETIMMRGCKPRMNANIST